MSYREEFLESLSGVDPIGGKRLFPDFPEGEVNLRRFYVCRFINGKYGIRCRYSCGWYKCIPDFCEEVLTFDEIDDDGFIVWLQTFRPAYKDYLGAILGKKIIHVAGKGYFIQNSPGDELPLIECKRYRYDEKTKNYSLVCFRK